MTQVFTGRLERFNLAKGFAEFFSVNEPVQGPATLARYETGLFSSVKLLALLP